MDDRCDYEAQVWETARTLKEEGSGLESTPCWPEARLARTGTCLGCEREGRREETYVVALTDTTSKKAQSCEVPETQWRNFALGSQWKGKIAVLTGSVDCDSLQKH